MYWHCWSNWLHCSWMKVFVSAPFFLIDIGASRGGFYKWKNIFKLRNCWWRFISLVLHTCLKLKGDCVCIFHQRSDFLCCTIVLLYLGLHIHLLRCLKRPVAPFLFSGMSPCSLPVWSIQIQMNPLLVTISVVSDEKAITFSFSSALMVQKEFIIKKKKSLKNQNSGFVTSGLGSARILSGWTWTDLCNIRGSWCFLRTLSSAENDVMSMCCLLDLLSSSAARFSVSMPGVVYMIKGLPSG